MKFDMEASVRFSYRQGEADAFIDLNMSNHCVSFARAGDG